MIAPPFNVLFFNHSQTGKVIRIVAGQGANRLAQAEQRIPLKTEAIIPPNLNN